MSMYIEGKWYEEPEIQAYIKQLKEDNKARFTTACDIAGKLKNQNDEMAGLLREAQLLLSRAFFAHYTDRNAADELYDRIRKYLIEIAE